MDKLHEIISKHFILSQIEADKYRHSFFIFYFAGVSHSLVVNFTLIGQVTRLLFYSRVHKSSDNFFSKILEKPSMVQKKMIPHMKGLGFSLKWSKKKFKMADSKNSKWPPQKNLVFQLRQFSIFFHEIFMDWSLG